MPTYKGRWTAKVEQDFEIEAEDEADFQQKLERNEMTPNHVIELVDFDYDVEEIVL